MLSYLRQLRAVPVKTALFDLLAFRYRKTPGQIQRLCCKYRERFPLLI
jgi:hypothetical protein